MVTRADLLAHLDRLSDAGHPATCWTVPIPERGIWTSDTHAEQKAAANLCATCPALTACADYGHANPREVGVIGGLTESQRQHGATTKETT